MKRVLIWVSVNSALAYCLYQGFVFGVAGAQNVAIAYAWAHTVFGIIALLCSESIQQKGRIAKRPLVIKVLNDPFDYVIAAFLVWHGHIALGVCFVFGTVGFSSLQGEEK
jgi:hypothetical protein